MEIKLLRMTVLTNRNADEMLLYDHIFHRDMCSMICQTTSRPDWPVHMTSPASCNLFLEMILKINFNNYLLLNEIEFVHIFFFRLQQTYKLLFNVSQKILWILPGASL